MFLCRSNCPVANLVRVITLPNPMFCLVKASPFHLNVNAEAKSGDFVHNPQDYESHYEAPCKSGSSIRQLVYYMALHVNILFLCITYYCICLYYLFYQFACSAHQGNHLRWCRMRSSFVQICQSKGFLQSHPRLQTSILINSQVSVG